MNKLNDLSTMLADAEKSIPIEIDGGIGPENTMQITAAGASILVAGSAIFEHPPYEEVIGRMKKEGTR
jgi:ribulose-phosphate 3-epimerase